MLDAKENVARLAKIREEFIKTTEVSSEQHGGRNPMEEFETFKNALAKATKDLEEARKQGF